jgi:hypothetical protein
VAQDLIFRPRSGLRRVPAGLAALIFPAALVVAALGVDFRAVGDGSDIATAVLATFMFVVAVPTAWIFAIDFIEAGRFTVVLVGVLTSFPIWFLLGTKLAQAASHWGEWIGAYLKICVIWTVFWIVLAQIVGAIVG